MESADLKEWMKEQAKKFHFEEKRWVESTWTNGKKHKIDLRG